MDRRDFLGRAALAFAVLAEDCAGKGSAAMDHKNQDRDASDRWIRPEAGGKPPIWGIRGGIQAGLWPASIEGVGIGGPRGLLRVGYPILDGGKKAGLVNFIAVEPIVGGVRGYSELERSGTDGKSGRVFWTGLSALEAATADPGALRMEGGVERLAVRVHTEAFSNGAQPIVELEFRADRPDELRLTVTSTPGSASMDCCILTATMGNYQRLRRLWLRDETIESAKVWPGFKGNEFTEDAFFPHERFVRMPDGDLVVCAASDEADPHSVPPDPAGPGWAYRGSFPLTQYWRKPKDSGGAGGLKARVNGRRLYWATHNPIPGGLAFENFELMEPFHEGQSFIFGLTRRTPAEISRDEGK